MRLRDLKGLEDWWVPGPVLLSHGFFLPHGLPSFEGRGSCRLQKVSSKNSCGRQPSGFPLGFPKLSEPKSVGSSTECCCMSENGATKEGTRGSKSLDLDGFWRFPSFSCAMPIFFAVCSRPYCSITIQNILLECNYPVDWYGCFHNQRITNDGFLQKGTPKSSILTGFSLVNHPAIGVPLWLWKPPYILIMNHH